MNFIYRNYLFGKKTVDVIDSEVCHIPIKFVSALCLQKAQPKTREINYLNNLLL